VVVWDLIEVVAVVAEDMVGSGGRIGIYGSFSGGVGGHYRGGSGSV
jgi:hypothetical protein